MAEVVKAKCEVKLTSLTGPTKGLSYSKTQEKPIRGFIKKVIYSL